jgi:hypothetical protein
MNRAKRQTLEKLLREHAKEDVPAFSVPLHQKIMEALRAQGLPQPAARVTSGRPWGNVAWKIGVPLAAAAAIAVVAWISLHPEQPAAKENLVQVKTPKVTPKPSPLEIPEVTTPELAGTNAIEDAKYAYLDRDARKLWMFVASQIPELPAEKKDR